MSNEGFEVLASIWAEMGIRRRDGSHPADACRVCKIDDADFTPTFPLNPFHSLTRWGSMTVGEIEQALVRPWNYQLLVGQIADPEEQAAIEDRLSVLGQTGVIVIQVSELRAD
jgi:hypothetical protein